MDTDSEEDLCSEERGDRIGGVSRQAAKGAKPDQSEAGGWMMRFRWKASWHFAALRLCVRVCSDGVGDRGVS